MIVVDVKSTNGGFLSGLQAIKATQFSTRAREYYLCSAAIFPRPIEQRRRRVIGWLVVRVAIFTSFDISHLFTLVSLVFLLNYENIMRIYL